MYEHLDFIQFLNACGQEHLVKPLQDVDRIDAIAYHILKPLEEALGLYLTIGGIEEVVDCWCRTRDLSMVDKKLDEVLESILPESLQNTASFQRMWKETAAQFARERTFDAPLRPRNAVPRWVVEHLMDALAKQALVISLHPIEHIKMPYRDFIVMSRQKIYPVDTGLYRRMAALDHADVTSGNPKLGRFRGILTEAFVLTSLSSLGIPLFFWNEGNTAEVDFIADINNTLIPIEVKTSTNVKSHSLAVYRQKYQPPIALRYSMLNVKLDDDLLNIPLSCFWLTEKLIPLALKILGRNKF